MCVKFDYTAKETHFLSALDLDMVKMNLNFTAVYNTHTLYL